MQRVIIVDTRSLVLTSCGSANAGHVFYKSQNGGDSPKSKGNNSPNPYIMQLSGMSDPIGTWQWEQGGSVGSGTATACGFAPYYQFESLDPNKEIELIQKLTKLVRGSDMLPSVFLAQAGESIHMVNSTASLLAKSMLEAKRGNILSAWRTLSNGGGRIPRDSVTRFGNGFTSGWLSFQYGWKPLYNDIAEAGNAISTMRATKRVSRQYSVSSSVDGRVVSNFGGADGPGTAKTTLRLLLICEQSNFSPRLPSLWDTAEVAWELVPYSFVLDWTLPISSYLNARAMMEQIEGKVVKTVFQRGKILGTAGGSYLVDMAYRNVNIALNRTIHDAATYQVPVPQLDLKLGTTRLLNGLSLLYQVVKAPISGRPRLR